MFSGLSLHAKLYLQFGIVLVPMFIVLGYFLQDNHTRFTTAMAQFAGYNAAVDAERQYNQFIAAVTDAVDTGKLGQPGLLALKQAHASLVGAGIESAKPLISNLNTIYQGLNLDGSLANLEKNRELIHRAKTEVALTAEQYNHSVATAINNDLERAKQGIFFSRALFVLISAVAIDKKHTSTAAIGRDDRRSHRQR
jgi:hypothetical protein